jgi:hypothetical protein
MPIAWVTDVEGQWERLRSFADGHPGVRLDADGALHVAEGWQLVFGGDAIDRGEHSRRIVRALVEVRRRQPAQVRLLVGNRDLNKLRLRGELSGRPPGRAPAEVASGPRPALLRWIFQFTMGAADAFEHRRVELVAEGWPGSDDDVVESFLADVSPGGDLFEYLALATMAVRVDGALFVHGGVSPESLGRVPGEAPLPPHEIDRWIAALDGFRERGLDAYRRANGVSAGRPAWQDLVDYQAPVPGTRANPASIIYGRNTDVLNNPRLPAPAARVALAEAGIDRVIVGHTPTGDVPALCTDGRLISVCADNSHARHPHGGRLTVDARGVVAEGVAMVDGALQPVVARLAPGDDGPIGRTCADGGQVRGQLGDGRWLVHRLLPGYQSENRAVERSALGPLGVAD